jgi:hypothetical protein
MDAVAELAIWIEEQRPKWIGRGVDVLADQGRTLFALTKPTGKLTGEAKLWIGSVEDCDRTLALHLDGAVRPTEKDFVPLIVLGEMSVEHAKVLIENAVERVAGR